MWSMKWWKSNSSVQIEELQRSQTEHANTGLHGWREPLTFYQFQFKTFVCVTHYWQGEIEESKVGRIYRWWQQDKSFKKVKARLFIKSQLSDEWNEASKLFHHKCSPSSFVSSGLSRWLRNKEAGCADGLGLDMVLHSVTILWYEARPFLISQILFCSQSMCPAADCW